MDEYGAMIKIDQKTKQSRSRWHNLTLINGIRHGLFFWALPAVMNKNSISDSISVEKKIHAERTNMSTKETLRIFL